GLAKTLDPGPGERPSSGVLEDSPTITSPALTRRGIILGTAAYMSPEQAKGRFLDKRTDVWSFGVVFYEMLTGTPLFAGETISDTMAAVLTLEPAWSRLPPDLPPAALQLVKRCLVRDPRQRLRDIGEARIALDATAIGDSSADKRPKVSWQ